MPEPRKKALHYLRAEYFGQNPAAINLGMCIKQATDKLQTIGQRSIHRTGGYLMRLAHFRQADGNSGYFLHLTFETPGEHASIIPRVATDAREVRVSTMPPPNDAEFMDGDAFLYVVGNNVCVCTTAVTARTVRYFLHELFIAAMIRPDASQFEFLNAVNVEKMALIQRKGIKEIEVRASMYRASADDDDYLIVTESGDKIKPNELILRSIVEIDGLGKSVNRDKAYSALVNYYSELERSGQLEQ